MSSWSNDVRAQLDACNELARNALNRAVAEIESDRRWTDETADGVDRLLVLANLGATNFGR